MSVTGAQQAGTDWNELGGSLVLCPCWKSRGVRRVRQKRRSVKRQTGVNVKEEKEATAAADRGVLMDMKWHCVSRKIPNSFPRTIVMQIFSAEFAHKQADTLYELSNRNVTDKHQEKQQQQHQEWEVVGYVGAKYEANYTSWKITIMMMMLNHESMDGCGWCDKGTIIWLWGINKQRRLCVGSGSVINRLVLGLWITSTQNRHLE